MAWRDIPRCSAISRSTGLPCKNPALAGTGGLCRSHARSTGPRTTEGKLAIQRNLWRHGKRSKAALAEKSASATIARALLACLLHEMRGQPVPERLVKACSVAMERWREARAARLELEARIEGATE